ncbi:MAG: hypothetical protein HOW73_26160 [Polyangiaceae bacterium]|nr:hypothetical protein [Polyangiaceae bacterium]
MPPAAEPPTAGPPTAGPPAVRCPLCRTLEDREGSAFCRVCGGPLPVPGVDADDAAARDGAARKDTVVDDPASAKVDPSTRPDPPPAKPATTIADPSLDAPPPPGFRAVQKVFELTRDPPLYRYVATMLARVLGVAALVASTLLLLGYLRRGYGKSIAKALALRSNSVVLELMVDVLAAIAGALIGMLVFRLTARRWLKVR